jgi:hypothetical protein
MAAAALAVASGLPTLLAAMIAAVLPRLADLAAAAGVGAWLVGKGAAHVVVLSMNRIMASTARASCQGTASKVRESSCMRESSCAGAAY